MKPLCIYHSNCADGFGAAWVVRKALGEENVEFFPGSHGSPPPDVTGRDVIMFDFSYKRERIEAMLTQAKSLLIVDHHKSAQENLGDLQHENLLMIWDMDHSGAMMAWNYFYPKEEAPKLIQHIEDRDLWKFNLEGTREISAALFSYEYDFEQWDDLMRPSVIDQLYEEGLTLERKHHKDIKELLSVNQRKLNIGGHIVPAANLPYTLSSDAGHVMATGHPFAACYSHTSKGMVAFSLRSAPDGIDVSAIASQFGGGGHKHAAGFGVTIEEARKFEITNE